jgi:hypothetical protein
MEGQMRSARQTETRRLRRSLTNAWAAVLALALAATLAAACNGGGGGGGTATVQPTIEGSPIGSPIPQSTEQAATNPACQALASLKTYRYISNLELRSPEALVTPTEGQPTPVSTLTRDYTGDVSFDYDIDASFVAPDSVDAIVSTQAGEPLNIIAIGGTTWLQSASGQWQESPEPTGVPYQPLEICNAIFPQLNLEQVAEKDTVNDISAQHYVLPDTPSGQAFATIFGASSDMAILFQTMDVEVWVTDDGGWPVKMDILGSGLYANGRQLSAHITIELRDINNKDIKVEPPI